MTCVVPAGILPQGSGRGTMPQPAAPLTTSCIPQLVHGYRPDTVGQPPHTNSCASNLSAWQAKKPGKPPQTTILLAL